MSELRARALAIAALVEAFGVKGEDFQAARTRVYEDGLKDLPIPLLNAAVRRAVQTRTFFPKVAELRADAEACRKEMIEAHPYERCADCNRVGIVRVGVDDQGRPKYQPCKCWDRYQERLLSLGVTEKPVKQLPERTETQPEPVSNWSGE